MTLMYKARTATPRLRPGPGGLPRGQVTQIQRSRMLAAAVEAVEDVGYARMTVAQVIGRARVSRKTFYDVFTDREDCFLAAFEQALGQARLIAQEAYEQRVQLARRHPRGAGEAADVHGRRARARQALHRRGARSRREGPGAPRQGARRAGRGHRSGTYRSTNATREPPEVTAEGVVGAIFAVLHTRVLETRRGAAHRSARFPDEHDRAARTWEQGRRAES